MHVLLKWLLVLDEQCIMAVELHIWIYCMIKIFIKYENFVIYHMYKVKSRSHFCLEYSSNDFLSICSWFIYMITILYITCNGIYFMCECVCVKPKFTVFSHIFYLYSLGKINGGVEWAKAKYINPPLPHTDQSN